MISIDCHFFQSCRIGLFFNENDYHTYMKEWGRQKHVKPYPKSVDIQEFETNTILTLFIRIDAIGGHLHRELASLVAFECSKMFSSIMKHIGQSEQCEAVRHEFIKVMTLVILREYDEYRERR